VTEWRPIPTHDGYEASEDGRIRHTATEEELTQEVTSKGHVRVAIPRTNGRGKVPRFVHRLMALAFFGPQPTPWHTDVAHWDGDPSNNTIQNLRWATQAENAKDRIRHNREKREAAEA
jgi:hypothetical protein